MSDRWIREQALGTGMIEPFVESQKRDGCISYGLSSYGYDARVADDFKIFTNVDSVTVDPKAFHPARFVDRKTPVCIIPPNSFALARTVEYFRVPRDVLVICLGKSTYARCGIIVNVTPLEPGWEAQVRPRSGLALKHGVSCLNTPGTIDSDYRGEVKALLINLGDEPFTITRGMRIAQLVPAAVTRAELHIVESLDSTERGAGGFGSTGH